MTCRIQPAVCRGIALCGLLSLIAGLQQRPNEASKAFNPKGDAAREALTTKGAHGLAERSGRAGRDQRRRTGRAGQRQHLEERLPKLKEFSKLPTELPSDGPRKFKVKLTLDGAAAPKEVTYYVVGKDPLHVFSEDEYNRDAGM